MGTKRSTVYSNRQVVIEFAGILIDSGRGKDDGPFLRIEQEGDDFDYAQSNDGEGVFYQLSGGKTKVTLILMQTAAANATLSVLHRASKAAGGLPAPMTVKDGGGTGKFIAVSALIAKLPDEEMAAEPGTMEWPLIVHDPERLVGAH